MTPTCDEERKEVDLDHYVDSRICYFSDGLVNVTQFSIGIMKGVNVHVDSMHGDIFIIESHYEGEEKECKVITEKDTITLRKLCDDLLSVATQEVSSTKELIEKIKSFFKQDVLV